MAGEDIRVFDKREWSRVVSLVNQVYHHEIPHHVLSLCIKKIIIWSRLFSFGIEDTITFFSFIVTRFQQETYLGILMVHLANLMCSSFTGQSHG